MRRRFCGGTSHISDMLENGINEMALANKSLILLILSCF